MRAFAAAQFTLTRFGAWRAAMLGLSALVLLAVGTWLVTQQAKTHKTRLIHQMQQRDQYQQRHAQTA